MTLGKADWIYDREWDMHVPCCSRWQGNGKCHHGPLVGDQIEAGDCGDEHVHPYRIEGENASVTIAAEPCGDPTCEACA